MNVNKLAVSGILAVSLLAGCGGTVDIASENIPAPVESIEITADDPEVDDGNVTDPVDVSDISGTSAEVSPVIENPTFVQTGDYEYTIYVDCPDNSNAPELSFIAENDTVGALDGAAGNGPSVDLINAVMTHGMQVDSLNAAQINRDAYLDKPFEANLPVLGKVTYVFTDDASKYDENYMILTVDEVKYSDQTLIPRETYRLCAILLEDAIVNTNGNLTCALTRYNMGPEAWDQVIKLIITLVNTRVQL